MSRFLIAMSVLASSLWTASTALAAEERMELILPPPPAPLYDALRDPIQGTPRAPVQIIVYADFACPFCKTFHETMKEVIRKNGRRVSYVYRYYPLTQSHPNAQKTAQAADCAWRQGKDKAFWPYADALFEAADLSTFPYTRAAAKLRLRSSQFTQCLQNPDLAYAMEANASNAIALEIPGTPRTYVINRLTKVQLILDGAVDADAVQAAIDEVRTGSNAIRSGRQ